MSQADQFANIEKRRFENALVHLLATEYGFLQGGRRIMQLLTEDVIRLIEEFFPDTSRAASGTLVWTCTADEGRKAEPGKRTEEYKTVTVQLPLVTTEEVRGRSQPKKTPVKKRNMTKERDKKRIAWLVKAAAAQGGLLTIAEVSAILNRGYETVRLYIREWEEETGELLPLKGFRMDQGSHPTHKREIVDLYEQGKEPPDIAHLTSHSLSSVERYLKDYERVKLLLKQGLSVEDISALIDRGNKIVLQYVDIAQKHHPELFLQTNSGRGV